MGKETKDVESVGIEEYPTPKASIVAFISSLGLVLTVGSFVQLYAFLPGLYITEWILILGPPLILLMRKGADIKKSLSLQRLTARHVLLGVLGGLGVYFLMLGAFLLMTSILGPYPEVPAITEAFPTTWLGFVPWVLGMGFSAGFCEEILFRGFIQNGLCRRWGKVKAVTITAILFAVFHVDPWRGPGILLFGLLVGYLLTRTGSLFTSMAFHVAANSLSQVLAFTQTFPTSDVEWALVTILSVLLVSITLYLTEKTRSQQARSTP